MAIEECGSSINRNYLLEPLQAKETSSGNSAVQRGGHRKTKSLPSKHSWDLLSKPEYESCFADGSILKEGRLTLQILQDGEASVAHIIWAKFYFLHIMILCPVFGNLNCLRMESPSARTDKNQMNRNQMDMGDSQDHVGEAARIRIISNRHQRSCKGHKRSSSQHDMLRLRKQRPCSTVDHKTMSRLLDEDARIYFEKYVSVSRLESAGGEDLTINKRVLQKASREKPVKNDSDFEAAALTKPEIRPVNGDGIVVPWLESEDHVTSVNGRFGKVIHDGSDVKFNKQLSYKKGNRKLCIIECWNTAAYAGHSLNARYFNTKCFQSHKFHFKSKVQHGRLLLCGRKI